MDHKFSKVPFLTRAMLKFGNKANLELVVTSRVVSSRKLFIRLVNREGMSEFTHENTGTGVRATTTHKISDIPTLLSVVDETAEAQQGESYVTVSLQMNGEIVYQLASGYVYEQKGISWPQSLNSDILPGRGGIKVITTANPATGAEISGSVPSGQMWRVLYARFNLTTDGTSVDRRVHVQFGGNINDGIDIFSGSNQTATLAWRYSLAQYGLNLSAQHDNDLIISLPDNLYMVGNEQFSTDTTNLQAGDDFSPMELGIEQLFEKDN